MTALKLSRLPSGEPEIFASIQGEGVTAGVPSAFVRLSICNLRCAWCDTRYTWDWQNYNPKQEIIQLEVDDILERVERLDTTNIVLTGGEPLLQQQGLELLAMGLRARGHTIEVETNGTVRPSACLMQQVGQWNVSPKLANSDNATQRRKRPDALCHFAMADNAYFKFVIEAPEDVDEVTAFAGNFQVPSRRILLMPEARDPVTLQQRSEWLAPLCREVGYRFATRLHVLLWGDKRGR